MSTTTSEESKSATKRIKRLKVIVTQKEIDEAVRGNSHKCMIQHAIKRDHPDFERILVDKEQVRFTDPKTDTIYTFGQAAVAKTVMLVWDDGQEIKPYDFWLRNPVTRVRVLKKGSHRARASQDRAMRHVGAVPNAKTKEARLQRGRDRVFGQKLWTAELTKLRGYFGTPSPSPTEGSSPSPTEPQS